MSRSSVARWMLPGLWAAAIFAVSSVPGSGLPSGFAPGAHFVEYGVLGMLLYWAAAASSTLAERSLLAISLASAYGVTDELHQAYVATRTPETGDWAMDTAGAVAGALAMLLVDRAIRRRTAAQ